MRTRTGLAAAVLLAALPAPAAATTLHVTPGHSIQAAVDAAQKGDTVMVSPGTFSEKGQKCPAETAKTCAVVVRKDGIKLIAAATKDHPVVLAGQAKLDVGIAVARADYPKCIANKALRVKGSLVDGFTVRGFRADGVFVVCVDGWRVTRVRTVKNDEYGVFPLFVGAGRVDHSFASGANDTGIYIGQSHDVRIDHDTATGNVSGFEIENSRRVRADHNLGFGNTAGILSFAEPGLFVKTNHRNVIENNTFRDNNRKNTCLDPSDTVCNVPPGAGIVLAGPDLNVVRSNVVKGNGTGGIGLVSWCIIEGKPNCSNDSDPNPDYNVIRQNVVTGNGKHPDPKYAAVAADLIWDGTGQGNCWAGNTASTRFPKSLPGCD
jgi:parallel beta-helix repeat protein